MTPRRTSDGGYICRGGKDSTIVVGHYEDVSYVTKKDAQGNTLWRTFFTSTEAHTFWMAQEVKDGNYVAVGSALDEETEGYEDDGWIVKLDQQGGVMWERRYQFHSGAPIVNRLRGFHPTDDGGIIATGTTVTEKEPGPGWYTTFWLLKLDSVGCLSPGCDSLDTPVFHMPVEENTFTVYPNPAVDKVFAQAQLPSHVSGAEMKIFSLKGEELAHRTVVGNQIVHFRVGDYPAGMYIVTLEIEQRVVARKKLMVVR